MGARSISVIPFIGSYLHSWVDLGSRSRFVIAAPALFRISPESAVKICHHPLAAPRPVAYLRLAIEHTCMNII
jgi:hypothetical protein